VKDIKKIENELEYERDREEFRFLILVSQAWQEMMRAEAEASPSHYKEAAEHFEKAKEFSSSQRSKMLVLGHSRFCKALEIGMRIASAMNKTEYFAAKRQLENAYSHYTKARFQEASEYAKATELLFDAYWHIDCAKKESDPEEKAKRYMMAEKVLQKSVTSFKKAKHFEKREQVAGILVRVREVRELAISLASLLSGSRIASTRTTLTVPTPSYEEAVGLERFEHADVRASVMTHRNELSVGEDLDLEIELVNVGKGSALLTKIRGIVPEGFEVITRSATMQTENNHFNLKGKRLDSLKTEEIRLVVRPKAPGVFTLDPVVFYLDENGKYKASQADQMTLTVKQPISESSESSDNLLRTGFSELDKLLYGGVAQNSAVILATTPNDERVTLIRSYLETGLNSRQITFYMTTRASSMGTLAGASRSDFQLFVCNPQADAIVEDGPNVFKFKGVENLTEISIALMSLLNKLPAPSNGLRRRACIDILSDALLQHGPVNTRRWLNSLIPQLKSKGFTILAVIDPEMHSSKDLHAILDIFDGEIIICEKETPRGPKRFLRILRMQDQKYSINEQLLGGR
jgi:KaiC/GvpD/RAD55 family RecA-like ATPase/tetratricopeptide (TPR) repeat protein